MSLSSASFEFVRAVLRERSGHCLEADKAYLVESRMLPVLRRWQFASLKELAQSLRERPPEGLADQVVEAMTTNESFFFRDGDEGLHQRQAVHGSFLK